MTDDFVEPDPYWDGPMPADPEQLAAEEDRRIRDQLGEPNLWPDDDRDYQIARERAPQPGVPLQRPSQKGDQE